MIKRWAAFISIVLLVIFPASSFNASAKSTVQEKKYGFFKKGNSKKIFKNCHKRQKIRKNQEKTQ